MYQFNNKMSDQEIDDFLVRLVKIKSPTFSDKTARDLTTTLRNRFDQVLYLNGYDYQTTKEEIKKAFLES